jgi:hypothetical protein
MPIGILPLLALLVYQAPELIARVRNTRRRVTPLPAAPGEASAT